MKKLLNRVVTTFAAALLIGGVTITGAQAGKVRIALAETPSDEVAAFLSLWIAPGRWGLTTNGQRSLTRNWLSKRSEEHTSELQSH